MISADTGIVDRIPTLDFAIVLKRRSFRVPVGITGGNIHAVQDFGLIQIWQEPEKGVKQRPISADLLPQWFSMAVN
jgi:hypothetical protein